MRIVSMIALLLFAQQASALYFYLQRGMVKCFKDELVKSSVSEFGMFWRCIFNDYMIFMFLEYRRSKHLWKFLIQSLMSIWRRTKTTQPSTLNLRLQRKKSSLLKSCLMRSTDTRPNLVSAIHICIFSRYQNVSIFVDGEFKLCMKISENVFDLEGVKEIKTQLKFSNEYYNCKRESNLLIIYSWQTKGRAKETWN